MKNMRVSTVTVVAVLALAGTVLARSATYMGRRTNAPGENTCTNCHSGSLNPAGGSAWFVAPAEYIPRDTITVFVSVQAAGKVRWGFEVTALDTADLPIGTMIRSDVTNTQKTTDAATSRQYIHQTGTGTYANTPDSSRGWTYKWAAPAAGAGPVVFYMCCLAADGSSTGGDKTYATTKTVAEATGTGVNDDVNRSMGFTLGQNYPNPFNPSTAILYDLPRSEHVQIVVYNVTGQVVRVLVEGVRSAGQHTAIWNGTDDHGNTVAAGVYYYRLSAGNVVEKRKMVFLK